MTHIQALRRGLITSIGHVSLLVSLLIFGVWLDTLSYIPHEVSVAVIAGSSVLLISHLITMTIRERMRWFTSHDTIIDLKKVNEKLDIIIENIEKYGHATD